MLREQLWFDFCDDLPIEIEQRIDEGILEAERFKERAEQVKEMPRGAARTAAGAELLEQLCALENPQDEDEPSDLLGIKAASVGEPKEKAEADCDKSLRRVARPLCGLPVGSAGRGLAACTHQRAFERDRQPAAAKSTFRPISGPVLREKTTTCATTDTPTARKKSGWINNVSYMPEDDDTNYTLIALKLVEQYGARFSHPMTRRKTG